MGLLVTSVRFEGAAPNESEVRAELESQFGSSACIDSYSLHERTVQVTTTPDPVCTAYLVKVLLGYGGMLVSTVSGQALDASLPEYTCKTWQAWPRWRRLLFRLKSSHFKTRSPKSHAASR